MYVKINCSLFFFEVDYLRLRNYILRIAYAYFMR